MKSNLDKNTLVFLLSSIGLIVFPHIYNIPLSIFGFFQVLLIWRFIGIWKIGWLPNKNILALLVICGLVILISQHRSVLGRDGGTSLFVIALALKLMEINSERDLCLITYLAFIVAASLFLYEQSLLMAAYIVMVSCVLLATLVCINSYKPDPRVALKKAGIIIIQAIPMTIILFILFPRIEAPRWMLFEEQHQTKLGLSDHMEPGSISDLGKSNELAFRVKFNGAIPPQSERYWRGPVFSYTNGKNWTPGSSRYKKYLDEVKFSGTAYQYTILMEPQERNWVYALDMPQEFSPPLMQNASYQIITSADPNKRAEYKITSNVHYNTGYITKTELRDGTQLPSEPSDRIKQLVTRLHGFDSPPENFIKEVLNHFKKENFHYTLTPPVMENNPIESFLFETRYGFCSHYASAFVYLMRVAKVPARVVTGYQGGEFNKVGDFLEIRQVNAHAWTEVWLENKGWVRVDPTTAIAPERVEEEINVDQFQTGGIINFAVNNNTGKLFNALRQVRQLWNNADYQWQRLVVNYDNMAQSRFLSLFGINDIKAMCYWMISLFALITILLSGFLLYSRQKNTDKVLRIYNQFSKKCHKHGLIRATGEGAKDFAERVKLKIPEQTEAIDKITRIFIKLRYERVSNLEDIKQLSKLIDGFNPGKSS